MRDAQGQVKPTTDDIDQLIIGRQIQRDVRVTLQERRQPMRQLLAGHHLRHADAYAATGLRLPADCVVGGFGTSFVNAQNPPKYSIHSTLGFRLFDKRLDTGIRRTYNSGPTHELDKPWNTTAA